MTDDPNDPNPPRPEIPTPRAEGPTPRADASIHREAAGKVIAGVRAGRVEARVVEAALAESLRIDVTIDRLALRECLESRGIPRHEAWRIALETRLVENSVALMTREERGRR